MGPPAWSVFEHEGFRDWAVSGSVPEGMRVAFVDGEVLLELSPEATEIHNKPKSALTAALVRLVDEGDLGEAYVDGVLVSNEHANLSTEPDFVFVSWQSFTDGRVQLVEKAGRQSDYVELEGTPDLVVEIVSDTSIRKDTKLLREAYCRAGVSEYWLIDARGDGISFQILELRDGKYEAAAPDGELQHSNVLGRSYADSRQEPRESLALHPRRRSTLTGLDGRGAH